ncbi:armadillo-type protein [Podospora fimiseda]|uniref:Nucleolar protein 9 n=1 Tax=Podospora fimiseda TaxID=252190 RepID=A0AAN7BYF3_9PEZI|nr:armadillo-type protein [Podospora fimiseda]
MREDEVTRVSASDKIRIFVLAYFQDRTTFFFCHLNGTLFSPKPNTTYSTTAKMGKNRKSKRQLIRDEKRAKKRGLENAAEEEKQVLDAKRQRHDDYDPTADFIPLDEDEPDRVDKSKKKKKAHDDTQEDGGFEHGGAGGGGSFEREFFGMLAEQEQEYFRRADELLELNDFPSEEERHMFLQNVYKEARGKELKLASSQSCSRLMERLILLSSTKQKKRIYDAFAGHFISLITHRFAGHCCEKLFLQSAPVVTQELKGDVDTEMADAEEEEENPPETLNMSMEDLLLLTLDEMEEHLSFLLSDRYGSHALRVLLVVLSGRPLDQAGTKSLLQGKNKEYVTVEGAPALTSELNSQTRAVPSSFTAAIQKIIGDSIANLDSTALRILAKHPTGNPTLQLLLDLELALVPKGDKKKAKKDDEEEKDAQPPAETLIEKLIPGAPASFSDEKSSACEFVNSMMYDPIGSRLLETLITHCPGKIFKGLFANIFGPRIQSLLRNDIASYPAIRVLNRLSKEDLAEAVKKCLPEIPSFIEKGRLNVVKTLFERCGVRNAKDELSSLLQALTSACNNNWKHIVPKLCPVDEEPEPTEEAKKKKSFQPVEVKNKSALLSHGSQVVLAMLEIPGQTSKAIQNSLLSLKPDQLMRMATSSAPTANIIKKALETPPQLPHFHKLLVAGLSQNIVDIALSQHGNPVVCAIIACPSKGEAKDTPLVPFHLKENIMGQLAQRESSLRETWLGRNVWRTWKGDLYGRKRVDWVRWAKETDPEEFRVAAMPKSKKLEMNVDNMKVVKEEEEEEKADEKEVKEEEEEEEEEKVEKKEKKKRKRDGDEKEEKKKKKKRKEKKVEEEEREKMEVDEE